MPPEITQAPKPKNESGDLLRFLVFILLFAFVIRFFVVQPFIVSGSSMYPTFENSECLLVDELTYRLSEPKRDDVVIFLFPGDSKNKRYYIKRIIGLPGEVLDIKGSDVYITNKEHAKGIKLAQPFVRNNSYNNLHVKLKDSEYFVMGDNRSASSDSRYWGPVPRNYIVGRAFLRLLPLSKISFLPGAYPEQK